MVSAHAGTLTVDQCAVLVSDVIGIPVERFCMIWNDAVLANGALPVACYGVAELQDPLQNRNGGLFFSATSSCGGAQIPIYILPKLPDATPAQFEDRPAPFFAITPRLFRVLRGGQRAPLLGRVVFLLQVLSRSSEALLAGSQQPGRLPNEIVLHVLRQIEMDELPLEPTPTN